MSGASTDGELAKLTDLGERILAVAALRGGKDLVADCLVRSEDKLTVRVRRGEPELVQEACTRSAGLRVIQGKRVASTSTSDLTDGGIERFVADAVDLVSLSQEDLFAGPPSPELVCDPSQTVDLDLYDPAGGAVDALQAIAWARDAEAAALGFDPRITNSQGAVFGRTADRSALLLSTGFRGTARGSYYSLSAAPLAMDADGKNRRGHHWSARRHLAELEPAVEIGREAARQALRRLGTRTVATCEVPVVFDPDSARSILGLLAGCILGSAIWRKASYLAGREGTRIASDLVTIIDDPLVPRAPGSRSFDGEGLASRRNVVVERGVLRTVLCDSYSARKLGRESTASASRAGGAVVGPSTSNFILQPGPDSREAILKSTKRGLYVTETMGFGFNSVTGDFSRGASGFWIEDGALTHPVAEVTISLNVDGLWQSLDAVGNDVDLRTSTAAPTLRVAKMTVAGRSG
jgi:PmbA protein